MTTNQERAADVIDRWTKDGGELNSHVGSPHSIAQALADAGLLAPDLPEPDHIETSPGDMPDIYTNGGQVYAVLNNGYDSDWECLDPSEATEFALRLLAAVRHARNTKEKHDE